MVGGGGRRRGMVGGDGRRRGMVGGGMVGGGW